MAKIQFTDNWEDTFKKAGICGFEDFFHIAGVVINSNRKRNVVAFSLEIDGVSRDFFMKRFIKPHYKDMFFTLRNFGRICSQGEYEYLCANELLKNEIDTYRPVCYGEEKRFGLETRSFFITEKIDGVCLTDFVSEKWEQMERGEKENLLEQMGKEVRKIHDASLSLPDLYVWHVFLTAVGDKYEFAFIDLHRMKRNIRSMDEQARNLGAMDFSMLGKYFDDSLKRVFIKAYVGESYRGTESGLWSKMKNRSRVLIGRRRRAEY
jgi:tRNA A-37 threonylcarbamoyl transferase component Bud32